MKHETNLSGKPGSDAMVSDAQRKVTSEQRGKEKSCVTWISIIFNNIGKDFFFDELDDLKSYHFTTNRGKTIMELK